MLYEKPAQFISKLCQIEAVSLNAITLFPIWKGQTAVCIAGGASLTQEQVDMVKGLKSIGVNDAYRLAPWLDILYACDRKWWEQHNGCPGFTGYKLQHYYRSRLNNISLALPYPDIDCVLSTGAEGFEPSLDGIKHGGNSGYQALHIAMHLGATKIILIGYDMHVNTGKSHWFGSHPWLHDTSNNQRYVNWKQEFPALEEAAKERGQRIINCTPGSALDCFETMDLQEALNE